MRRTMLALAVALAACGGPAEPPDRLFVHNGVILVPHGEGWQRHAALLAEDGEVVAIGDAAALRERAGEGARELDLRGGVATPGLVDAHAHLFKLGRLLRQVDLRGSTSVAECIERARELEARLPEGAWLQGRGWDQNRFDPPAYPTRQQLDAAFGDRPVVLQRVDGHAAWASSAALERAGIGKGHPGWPGGEILVDDSGEPTGILIDAADDSLRARIPAESPAELDAILAAATENALGNGLAGVHEMGVTPGELAALERARDAGTLGLRVVTYLGGRPALDALDAAPLRPHPAAKLRVEGVKLYVDGALGSRGAALLEDYSDRPGHRGLLLEEPAALASHIQLARDRGYGVAMHAIGDRANRIALELFAQHWPPGQQPRPRVEHVQFVHPDDRPRFAALGVVPSMQPTHCTSDMPWAVDRVGEGRRDGLYAWRQLRDDGNLIPLGSDFPVEQVDPRLGLYAARTRQQPDGMPPGGWDPQERLTAEEALLGFTRWPAAVIGVDAWGDLAPGSRCDLTVFGGDPLAEDPAALLSLPVWATVVEGRLEYDGFD